MSARRFPYRVRRVAALRCYACLAVFTDVDLSEGESFTCPKCLAGQPMDADDPWSLELGHGPSSAREDRSSLWRQDEGRIRTISGAAPASAKPSDDLPEPPDPFSPPPALPPLGHETNPEPKDILRGLRIAGSVIAVFVLALALLLVTSEFEKRRPPELPPPPPTPETLAARAAEAAEREARDRDAASVLRHWPVELDQFTPLGQEIIARMEVPEGGKIGIGDAFYGFERSSDGELRLVRIEEETAEPAEAPTVESGSEASEGEAIVEAP